MVCILDIGTENSAFISLPKEYAGDIINSQDLSIILKLASDKITVDINRLYITKMIISYSIFN